MTKLDDDEYRRKRFEQGFEHGRKGIQRIAQDKYYKSGHRNGKAYMDKPKVIQEHESDYWNK